METENKLLSSPYGRKKLREFLRILRLELPPIVPVEVRTGNPGKDNQAYLHLLFDENGNPKKFRMVIDRNLHTDALQHVIAHEWAHALGWGTESGRLRPHGPEWGMFMHLVWTALVED